MMNRTFEIVIGLVAVTGLISCGQISSSNSRYNSYSTQMTGQKPIQASRFSAANNSSFNSGATGSPSNMGNTAINAGTGYTQQCTPAAAVDFWGKEIPPTPQQCAEAYRCHPRFSGNFPGALAALTQCLNKAIISQNPQLAAGYQAMTGYQPPIR